MSEGLPQYEDAQKPEGEMGIEPEKQKPEDMKKKPEVDEAKIQILIEEMYLYSSVGRKITL